MSAPGVDAYLICGGKFHDINFARLELLKLLPEHEQIRVKVGNDFSDIEGIKNSDCLIMYACEVVPTEEEQLGLKSFLDGAIAGMPCMAQIPFSSG